MILEAIKPPRLILNGGEGTLPAPRYHLEPLRQPGGLVAVAHPNGLRISALLVAENPRTPIDLDLHPPVLLLLPNPNLAAELLNDELEAVADAKDEDAVGLRPLDEAVGEGRGARCVDGVGPAGEDDDAGTVVGDGGERAGAGDAEGEDGEGADSARDEVSVLGAVVEDEDAVGFHGLWVNRHCWRASVQW